MEILERSLCLPSGEEVKSRVGLVLGPSGCLRIQGVRVGGEEGTPSVFQVGASPLQRKITVGAP